MISLRDANVPGFADGSLYDDIDYQKPVARGLYLELDAKTKQHSISEKANHLLLSTPDSRSFSLSTPEVETFIGTSTSSLSTTTITPTSTRFLRPGNPVTSEQEMYAQGFLEALDQLQQSEKGVDSVIHRHHALPHSTAGHSARDAHFATTALSGPNPSLASVAPTYVTASLDYIPVSHSELVPSASYPVVSSPPGPSLEHATHNHSAYHVGNAYSVMNSYTNASAHHGVDNSAVYSGYGSTHPSFTTGTNPEFLRELHSVVPADMKTQEVLKVERKKARNRIAASKCRLRRLQRESDLTGKVRLLKEHNQELNNEVNGLREQILNLKRALLQHMRTGCQVNLPEGFRAELDSTASE